MLKNFTLLETKGSTRSFKSLLNAHNSNFLSFLHLYAFTHFDTRLNPYLLKFVNLNDT